MKLVLGRVDQHDFGVFQGRDLQHLLVLHGRAVAGVQAHAVDLDRADRPAPDRRGGPCRARTRWSRRPSGSRRRRAPLVRIGSAVVVAGEAAGQGHELAGAVALGEGLGAPAGLAAAAGRARSRSGTASWSRGSRLYSAWRMPLPALITCTSPASVRPLLPRLSWWVIAPFADVGDDLHVGVRVRREAGLRRDLVVVPHPDRAPAHAVRVVVAGEREVVVGLEPAVVGAAERAKGPRSIMSVSLTSFRNRESV